MPPFELRNMLHYATLERIRCNVPKIVPKGRADLNCCLNKHTLPTHGRRTHLLRRLTFNLVPRVFSVFNMAAAPPPRLFSSCIMLFCL